MQIRDKNTISTFHYIFLNTDTELISALPAFQGRSYCSVHYASLLDITVSFPSATKYVEIAEQRQTDRQHDTTFLGPICISGNKLFTELNNTVD